MGRTVATPSYSAVNVFIDISEMDIMDSIDFEMSVDEPVKVALQEVFPSLDEIDGWVDRECRKILRNGLSFVTVSEYCGLLAVSLVPDNDEVPELAEHWTAQVAPKFRKVLEEAYGCNALRKIDTFSNGEGVYERVAA